MKKLLLIAAILFSTLLTSNAWSKMSYGALLGGTYTTFTSGVDVTFSGANQSSLTPSGRFRYLAGAAARWEEDNWGFELDALYTVRNLVWHGTIDMIAPTSDFRYQEIYTLKQLEMPLIAYYNLVMPKRSYRFGFGLYTSYGLGKINYKIQASDTPGVVQSSSGNYKWSTIGFRKLNFGGIVSFGVDFKLTDTLRLSTEGRAQTTFTDIKNELNPNFSGGRIGLLSADLLVGLFF